jgi:hypothetical protein
VLAHSTRPRAISRGGTPHPSLLANSMLPLRLLAATLHGNAGIAGGEVGIALAVHPNTFCTSGTRTPTRRPAINRLLVSRANGASQPDQPWLHWHLCARGIRLALMRSPGAIKRRRLVLVRCQMVVALVVLWIYREIPRHSPISRR